MQREFVKKLSFSFISNIHTVLITSKQYDCCNEDCMQYITGINRYQSYFSTLEEQVGADNPVRLIDAFIEKLELQ